MVQRPRIGHRKLTTEEIRELLAKGRDLQREECERLRRVTRPSAEVYRLRVR